MVSSSASFSFIFTAVRVSVRDGYGVAAVIRASSACYVLVVRVPFVYHVYVYGSRGVWWFVQALVMRPGISKLRGYYGHFFLVYLVQGV